MTTMDEEHPEETHPRRRADGEPRNAERDLAAQHAARVRWLRSHPEAIEAEGDLLWRVHGGYGRPVGQVTGGGPPGRRFKAIAAHNASMLPRNAPPAGVGETLQDAAAYLLDEWDLSPSSERCRRAPGA